LYNKNRGVKMFRYSVLESVIKSISKDWSDENVIKQLNRLSSDELDKIRDIMNMVEVEMMDKEIRNV